MKRVGAASLAFVILAGTAGALAAGLKIELPPETATLTPSAGADLANEHCMICHSADYITTQPRDKPFAFWKAEVEKMKRVYGAPIPDNQIDPIAQYLAENYGTGK